MLTTVTNLDVRMMEQMFKRLAGKPMKAKCSFAVAKNQAKIKHIIEALDEAKKPADEYIEYERKRYDLVKEHAHLDDSGNPKIVGNEYDIKKTKRKDFDKKVEELKSEYQEAIEEMTKKIEEYEELLREEVEINLHFLDMDYLPETLSPMDSAAFMHFVRDSEDEDEDKPALKAVEDAPEKEAASE